MFGLISYEIQAVFWKVLQFAGDWVPAATLIIVEPMLTCQRVLQALTACAMVF